MDNVSPLNLTDCERTALYNLPSADFKSEGSDDDEVMLSYYIFLTLLTAT